MTRMTAPPPRWLAAELCGPFASAQLERAKNPRLPVFTGGG